MEAFNKVYSLTLYISSMAISAILLEAYFGRNSTEIFLFSSDLLISVFIITVIQVVLLRITERAVSAENQPNGRKIDMIDRLLDRIDVPLFQIIQTTELIYKTEQERREQVSRIQNAVSEVKDMLTPLINLSTDAGRTKFILEELDSLRNVCEVLTDYLDRVKLTVASGLITTLSDQLPKLERVICGLSEAEIAEEMGTAVNLIKDSSYMDRVIFCKTETIHMISLCDILASHLEEKQEYSGKRMIITIQKSLSEILMAIESLGLRESEELVPKV